MSYVDPTIGLSLGSSYVNVNITLVAGVDPDKFIREKLDERRSAICMQKSTDANGQGNIQITAQRCINVSKCISLKF